MGKFGTYINCGRENSRNKKKGDVGKFELWKHFHIHVFPGLLDISYGYL